MTTASDKRQGKLKEQPPATKQKARRTCWRLKREGGRRESSSPFLLGAPKNALFYNQKCVPNISHLHFFILSFGDQGGSYTEGRGLVVPKAALKQEVVQDEGT